VLHSAGWGQDSLNVRFGVIKTPDYSFSCSILVHAVTMWQSCSVEMTSKEEESKSVAVALSNTEPLNNVSHRTRRALSSRKQRSTAGDANYFSWSNILQLWFGFLFLPYFPCFAVSCPMCTVGSFPGGKAAEAWRWPLTFIWCWDQESCPMSRHSA
jgi:hypothetical protein